MGEVPLYPYGLTTARRSQVPGSSMERDSRVQSATPHATPGTVHGHHAHQAPPQLIALARITKTQRRAYTVFN